MKSSVFWNITPRSPLKVNGHFGATYRLHLQGRITRARYQGERWHSTCHLKTETMLLRNVLYPPKIVLFLRTMRATCDCVNIKADSTEPLTLAPGGVKQETDKGQFWIYKMEHSESILLPHQDKNYPFLLFIKLEQIRLKYSKTPIIRPKLNRRAVG
jgi:hypothetical protein